MPGASIIIGGRQDPGDWLSLQLARVARRVAFSRWYLGSSASMEWACLKRAISSNVRIVHMLWADLDLGFADLALRARGVGIVGTFHNCSDTIDQAIRFPKRLRKLSAVILMSESQRPFMLKAGVPQQRIHVVPHGVDTDFFVPNQTAKNDVFNVLTVGGYRRDFRRLKEFCVALKGYSNIRIRIVGPAAQQVTFANLANVDFLSSLNDEQLLHEYQNASCFIMMVEDATANNAILEAISCGLPVVADNIGGIPEYVDSSCAVLVNSKEVGEAVSAVIALSQSSSRMLDLSCGARCRAMEFRWDLISKRTQDVYRLGQAS
jgi:glycosyltransferase involved in cell wall biosynthesis